MKTYTVLQLKNALDKKEDLFLLDVRHTQERAYGVLPLDHHIPMHEIETRLEELPHDKKIIVYCRTGNRSGFVTSFLESKGFHKVFNLEGGILAWKKYDPSVKEY